jgi:hypothetical protein
MTDLAADIQKQNRLKMIRQALKDKAPLTYSELEASGRLKQFLEDHDAEMMISYDKAKNRVWEETLVTFLDFIDPPSLDETSSPM